MSRPDLRGWKLKSVNEIPTTALVPTRLEGMETEQARGGSLCFLPVPTRLEGMETSKPSGHENTSALSRPDLRGWKQFISEDFCNKQKGPDPT